MLNPVHAGRPLESQFMEPLPPLCAVRITRNCTSVGAVRSEAAVHVTPEDGLEHMKMPLGSLWRTSRWMRYKLSFADCSRSVCVCSAPAAPTTGRQSEAAIVVTIPATTMTIRISGIERPRCLVAGLRSNVALQLHRAAEPVLGPRDRDGTIETEQRSRRARRRHRKIARARKRRTRYHCV